MKKRTWTDEQLIVAVPSSISMAGVARELGLVPIGGTYKTLKTHIARLGIPTDHFTGQAWSGGRKVVSRRARPLEEVLVEGLFVTTNDLKARLLREDILIKRCYGCKRAKWDNFLTGEESDIPLELDHINGVNSDNRLENLRLLCPNCHALTPTYRGKNKKRL